MPSPNRTVLVGVLVLLSAALAAQTLNTTTTLAAETGNNTSSADSFSTQSNGNLGATNISKVPLSTLLYNGNATKIYVHFMPWFGGANHMNVGYASNDAAQVKRQVSDMLSRGARGAIVDWYGPNHTREDQTTQFLRNEAESRSGQFEFAVMEDHGALSCSDTASCTSALLSDISYANAAYFSSPAYMRINGRPVLFFFGVESLPMDWNAVRQGALGNPLFIFENSVTRAADDGGFSWVHGIDSFYSTALQYPGKLVFGSAAKGFNDTLASWGSNRITAQNCGQFWLTTWGYGGQFWSTSDQLPALQVVTWNDYEEGTEIESGIDNCVSISASVSGSTLSWAVTGSESTIDHYTVFASRDQQNLAPLGDVVSGTHSFNLASANLPAGDYWLYIKAVGRPSLTNKMSPGVGYTSAGSNSSPPPGPASSPDIALALAPASIILPQGQAGTASLSVSPKSGFSGTVTLSCSNLPAGAQCSFASAALKVGASGATTTVNIATASANNAVAANRQSAAPFRWFGLTSPGLGLAGLVLAGNRKRSRRALFAISAVCVLVVASLAACGGTSSRNATTAQNGAATPKGNYQVTLTATSGSLSRSTTLTLAVQ